MTRSKAQRKGSHTEPEQRGHARKPDRGRHRELLRRLAELDDLMAARIERVDRAKETRPHDASG